MTWRDALRAMAVTARQRAKNSGPMPNDHDPIRNAERAGARYAFGVMAEEIEYLVHRHTSPKEAVQQLRRWLAQAEARTAEQVDDPEEPAEERDGNQK